MQLEVSRIEVGGIVRGARWKSSLYRVSENKTPMAVLAVCTRGRYRARPDLTCHIGGFSARMAI